MENEDKLILPSGMEVTFKLPEYFSTSSEVGNFMLDWAKISRGNNFDVPDTWSDIDGIGKFKLRIVGGCDCCNENSDVSFSYVYDEFVGIEKNL